MKRHVQLIKKIAKVIVFFAIAILLFLAGEYAAGATQEESSFKEPYVGVTTTKVNMYTYAGKKVVAIPKGEEISVKAISHTGTNKVWVNWRGLEGIVLADYLEEKIMLGITTSELNQRDKLGNVIQCIPKGEIVSIKGLVDGEGRILAEWNSKLGSVLNNCIDRSFILINLEKQELVMYKDSEIFLQSPTVTGTYGTSRETPTGVFSIYAMSTKTTLRGQGYASYVEYWMPFYGGYGIHDADGWRSSYGGEIYKTNGSHGCVNLPRESAKTVYENAYVGMIVKIE